MKDEKGNELARLSGCVSVVPQASRLLLIAGRGIPQPASAGLPAGQLGQPFYGWFMATDKPVARFNGLTATGFSHTVAEGSSRGEKDAKAPSGVLT
ncbi:MAG TPA: hypothetical protein VKA60_17810 [Blastocatellia bacterium]|nr:hypothetical protein [Blastocatellia bacterium]